VQLSQNGCSVFSNCYSITIVGVERLAQLGIQVYPNPTAGILSIDFKQEQRLTLTVLDAKGWVVVPSQEISHSHTLNLERLPTGLYYLSIITANEAITTKIIKQ
jgi:hypothetical protein